MKRRYYNFFLILKEFGNFINRNFNDNSILVIIIIIFFLSNTVPKIMKYLPIECLNLSNAVLREESIRGICHGWPHFKSRFFQILHYQIS